jgi:hypothetical protein
MLSKKELKQKRVRGNGSSGSMHVLCLASIRPSVQNSNNTKEEERKKERRTRRT